MEGLDDVLPELLGASKDPHRRRLEPDLVAPFCGARTHERQHAVLKACSTFADATRSGPESSIGDMSKQSLGGT